MIDCYFVWQDGCRFDSDASAAWAQAFLSGLAILAAWKLQSLAEARASLRERKRELAALQSLVAAISGQVVACLASYRRPDIGFDGVRILIPTLIAEIEEIRSISVQRLDDDGAAASLTRLRVGLGVLRSIFETAIEGSYLDSELFAQALLMAIPPLHDLGFRHGAVWITTPDQAHTAEAELLDALVWARIELGET